MSEALSITGLVCAYQKNVVLHGIDLRLTEGEVLAVLGRNGAGKTTLINTIMGTLPSAGGTVKVNGSITSGWPSWRTARHGVAIVPQGRRLWPSLTVAEHLFLRPSTVDSPLWTLDGLSDLLPVLRTRWRHRAAQLSGGEARMVALARALLANPKLLLLDEPSEGLAPAMVQILIDIIRKTAASGCAIMLAEHHQHLVTEVAGQSIVLSGHTMERKQA
jgi:branched-chain amino acid transport system ATP-binding protein